ncbi:fungal-specific transcription factor domain-containing protein [Xylaria bambusicola]|uniref:fungal-specific transcription factor domain-containing protein n=1 Tax=Xylaria bambusicola TaxID=326684 RepID=UPI0020081288|nr:fungal-specific transcription factor domain-containing protein [Xylaria bambusicola]KAI0520852.1 fungal-specific transcription factor domain-containing protein [Xylaria bambusicola]
MATDYLTKIILPIPRLSGTHKMEMVSKGNGKRRLGTRSQNGCWTCKLRRKKCDEHQPICKTCEVLRISCEGYGPKPIWMDRGPLEKETAERVKMAVALNGPKRTRNRRKATTISTPPVDCSRNTAARDEEVHQELTRHTYPMAHGSDGPSMSFDDLLVTNHMNWQDSRHPGIGDMDMIMTNMPSMSPLTFSSPIDLELGCFSFSGIDTVSPKQPLSIALTEMLQPEGKIITDEGAPNETPLEQPELPQADPVYHNRCFSYGRISPMSSISAGSSSADSRGSHIERAMLLSYYMSKVIPKQFLFAWVSNPEDMQWLQFLLLSCTQVLEVSMVLSKAYYLNSFVSVAGSELPKEYDDQLSEISRILKTFPSPSATISLLDDEQRISQTISACACLIQCIQLEIFYGGSSCWVDYLQEAGQYTQSLIDLTISSKKHQLPAHSSLAHGESVLWLTTGKALLSKLIWLDVLATVSTGKGPFLGIKHNVLLHSAEIDMVKASGCHNDVVLALNEITALKSWKMQAESQRRLSTIELVTRGSTIVDSLNNLISSQIETSMRPQVANGKRGISPELLAHRSLEELSKDITIVYARAAIVHVHFVLSGSNLHIDEIRIGTVDLIKSLKGLCKSGMIDHALWPLCVAACAIRDEDEEQCLFQFIDSEDRDQGHRHVHKRTYHAIRQIGRECRNSILVDGGSSCWVNAMDRVQNYILLA